MMAHESWYDVEKEMKNKQNIYLKKVEKMFPMSFSRNDKNELQPYLDYYNYITTFFSLWRLREIGFFFR